MNGPRHARTRGAALVVAMLLAAVAAAVIATLAASQSQWMRSVELRRDQVQAQALVLAGLAWSRQIVELDARAGPYDHLGEPWALPLPPTPLENGFIEGRIIDAQGLLNLNNLAADGTLARVERARLERLFQQAGLQTQALDALADWIDADDIARERGAEAPAYAQRGSTPPNALLLRSAEATLVQGIGEAAFAAIASLITALPAATPLNVNTAPAEVLATALNGLSGDSLAAIVADRASKPFTTIGEFRSRLPAGVSLDDDTAVAVRSDYFLVTVKARQGETVAQGRSLVRRRSGAAALVVWQTVE